MKRIIGMWVVWVCVWTGLSAQPRMAWDAQEQNLGELLWKRAVTATFKVTNKGNEPLRLLQVEGSCDCLKPVWTQTPIRPKETGTVSVTFDARMLGSFETYVEVVTNASAKPLLLMLKGVVCTEITDYSKEFPIQMGKICLDKNALEFPDVNKGESPVLELNVANASAETYEPVLMHLPAYLEAKAMPERLEPKKIGKIQLTLLSDKLPDWGLTHTSVYLARFPGDKVSEENELPVMAVLLPDFSQLTDTQRALAPAARLSASRLELALRGKKSMSQTVLLTNTGKSVLEIERLQVSDPSLNIRMKKRSLRPGESMKVTVTVVAKYVRKRRPNHKVMLITNDPSHPKVGIDVRVSL